ncbi:amino acid transporter [Byssothecium circinans]|uniref:Amino acid transporter n=1 Tax=Byssothecium circinans TaxID=147558 RepID=A0A6A5U7T0_9PLEO|nr:amino acid transporter [Byssothecium circinans]
MQRLGKAQVFKRNFGYWSVFGFASLYMSTWEYVLVSLSSGFANGGFGGIFWTFIATTICFSTVVLSLAELESMAPTSGGMYSWTSELAPAQYQKWLSYISGWMSSLGWIASVSSGAYVSAALVQDMISVTNSSFELQSWQLTLVMLGFICLAMVVNNWGSKILPGLQFWALGLHLVGLVAMVIALIVANIGRTNSPYDIFIHATSSSGSSNVGMACLISQVSVIYCNLGSDAIVHISEEVPNASTAVPSNMLWSYVINGILGLVMLITMLLCIGPIDDVLQSDAPHIGLFQRAGLPHLTFILVFILHTLMFCGNITALATASREVWAFARDKGFPFSEWISVIDKDKNVPTHSVYITTLLAGLFCLANMGSILAFESITSLCLLGLLSTYTISIGCLLYRRLTNKEIPARRFSLGRYGTPINLFAFIYCIFIMIFACFPTELPVTTASANWAPLVWTGTITLSAFAYMVHGSKYYEPPVDFIKDRRAAGTKLQSVPVYSSSELRTKR